MTVNGFGNSYEYSGWQKTGNQTRVDWYPFKKIRTHGGEPKKVGNVKFAHESTLLEDADEGGETGPLVVNAPNGKATNNFPEPWDNHGALARNRLYADGHALSLGEGHWINVLKKQQEPKQEP